MDQSAQKPWDTYQVPNPTEILRLISQEKGIGGLDINLQGVDGQTALMLAAASNQLDCVNKIISLGADVNLVDKAGNTALLIAAKKAGSGCISALINAGSSIDLINNAGNSPLHLSIERSHKPAIDVLIKNQADIHIRNQHGVSPIALAIRYSSQPVVELLLSKGADPDDVSAGLTLDQRVDSPSALLVPEVRSTIRHQLIQYRRDKLAKSIADSNPAALSRSRPSL